MVKAPGVVAGGKGGGWKEWIIALSVSMNFLRRQVNLSLVIGAAGMSARTAWTSMARAKLSVRNAKIMSNLNALGVFRSGGFVF